MQSNVLAATVAHTIAAAEANIPRDDEYQGDDGLMHCKVCGEARQTVITIFDKTRTVRCVCRCYKEREQRRKLQESREAADRRRRVCFQGTNMSGWSFDNDDRQRPELSDACRKYADQFAAYQAQGRGLLLYGSVGTGKTYLAACIANSVIDRGYIVRMTNFAEVANQMQSTWEKQEYIDDLCGYDLLIIDDLGAERKSEYMQEMVFNIIDARYRAGGPVIITTNLTPEELVKPGNIGYSRIYDRIMERCLAIKVEGPSRRRKAARESWDDMRRELGLEV